MRRRLVLSVVLALVGGAVPSAAAAASLPPAGPACDGSQGEWSATVLLFTEGTSAPAAATDAVCAAAGSKRIAVELTDNSEPFTTEGLAPYDAVLFLSNAGDVLTDAQQDALQAFIGQSKGYAGIHRAAGAEPDWAFYGDLAGARLGNVAAAQQLRVEAVDAVHPSTTGLPRTWTRTDAWPSFTGGPRGKAHVLAQLDGVPPYTTAQPARDDHPIAWCQTVGGGRSWYTGLGGTDAGYAEPDFRAHLAGGIAYAAGTEAGDCAATLERSFQKVQLDRGVTMGEPMELAVLPDERVLYINRGTGGATGSAQVRVFDPESKSTAVAATIPVDQRYEDGLLGITLDPGFATNNWVYLYYSAQGEPLRQRLSRFTLTGDELDMSSEKPILEIPTERDLCCHSAGSMDWDATGNLYLAVGDNTNSMASDGMVPIDERPIRHPQYDAQRTAGNTNDLRGKILRIKPLADPGSTPGVDSTYQIPAGNLFPEPADIGDQTRPEIYVMGVRNPFRIAVDERTNTLFWGEVGPDAGQAIPNRGPAAHDEYNRATEAGNYGWPYCGGPNIAYNDFDFANGTSGPLFPCGQATGPVNDSPRNTGLQQLPPTKGSTLWEAKPGSPTWPEMGSACCSSAFGGEVYDPDAYPDSEVKFPRYYEDHWFIYEWQREWIKEVAFDEQGPDDGQPIEPSPWMPGIDWVHPMDMEFGPQGNLYVLEYGDGYFSGSPTAGLYRVDYVGGERSPRARIEVDRDSGPTPLTVTFSGEGSSDPDGDPITYAWDFTNDGTIDATGPTATHTYTTPGAFTAKLTVTDDGGRTGFENVEITAGNTRPVVASTAPWENGLFDWEDEVAFAFSATDAEDGAVPCTAIDATSAIVHAGHTHQDPTQDTCEGTIQLGEHDEEPGARFAYIVDGSYTDQGAGAAPALTARKTITLYPKRWQAEHLEAANGAAIIDTGTAAGGQRVGSIEHDTSVEYGERDLRNIARVTYRVSSGGAGGTIEMRADSPTGPLVSSVDVPNTGGWDAYRLVSAPVTDPGGSHKLFLAFKNPGAGDAALLDVDWFELKGKGVAVNAKPYDAAITATPPSGPVPLAVQLEAAATDPEGQPLTYRWDFDDGETGEGQSVSHTFDQSGSYRVEVTATDPAGRSTSATLTVNAFAPATCARTADGYCVLDLKGQYDNDAISEDGDYDDGNFDDAGWAYAAETLPAEGPVTYEGVPFDFPSSRAGIFNTVEANGQTLPLAAGTYSEIKLLGAAHHGNQSAAATVTYTSGAPESVPLELTDWAGTPQYGESVAIAAPHRHDQSGDTGPPVNIYLQTMRLDADRVVESITLPDEPRLHVFALSLKVAAPVQCTITGTPGDDVLTGTDVRDVICGGEGNDRIAGGGGDDDLYGNAGDDTLSGGAGTDACTGGSGIDTARECETQTGTSTLELSPARSSTYTDETHDAVASFEGDDPPPPAGTAVRFELYRAGQKVDEQVVDSTAEGTATYSYGHDQPAQDVIVACTGADSCDAPDVTRRAEAANRIIAPPVLEGDYDLLFDGASADGWRQAGPGEVRVEDGSLVTYGGLGLFWYSAAQYTDFSLKLSWKLTGETNNSGVFVRFPDPGNDPGVAIDNGYEVQIYDAESGEPQKTGSIYNFKREERRNSNPIGEWNDYEIRAVGHTYTVILNGEVVNTFTGSRNLAGYIGLQNHDPNSHVHFRYVRVKELTGEEDTTAPVTEAVLDPAQPGPGGTYRGPVTVTLAASDVGGSGVAKTEYRTDGGSWTAYEGPFTVSGAGDHSVDYRSVDGAGNREADRRVTFSIRPPDPDPPPPDPPPADQPPAAQPPPGSPPAPKPAAASLTQVSQPSLATFLRRGLRARLRCPAASTGTARLLMSRRAARRVGLRGVVLVARMVRCGAGETIALVLKPTARTARALRRAAPRGLSARLEIRLRTDRGDPSVVARRVRLRAP